MYKPSPVPILEDLFSFGGLMQKCNKESRLLPTYSILRGRLGGLRKNFALFAETSQRFFISHNNIKRRCLTKTKER